MRLDLISKVLHWVKAREKNTFETSSIKESVMKAPLN